MIKNIIFDFGDIFINLDKAAFFKAMFRLGCTTLTPELDVLSKNYEMGLISSREFTLDIQKVFPKVTEKAIRSAWNSMILDFPEYRLEFIRQLKSENKYRLFLLSNTNALHIDHVIKTMGKGRYLKFKNCFEQFYLSHEIHLRKPNGDIYEFVLKENNLIARETFFIDDTKENTDTAESMGIRCWNLKVGKEDIVQLTNKL
ncbi:HAD-IA family hydrolase [Maribacter sp. 2304DJ31-5]|uniref:HAD-IA family hydrolase n=1 Tax=Maribacter sp. 2304DJ31-5 TaxID=3386273 RepID=UPI0039BCB812